MGFHSFTEPNKKAPTGCAGGGLMRKGLQYVTLGSPLRHARSLLQHDLQQFDF